MVRMEDVLNKPWSSTRKRVRIALVGSNRSVFAQGSLAGLPGQVLSANRTGSQLVRIAPMGSNRTELFGAGQGHSYLGNQRDFSGIWSRNGIF